MLDTTSIKRDFPIFNFRKDLIYLDSTATSLKPRSVIDKISEYYSQYSANIFRGVYQISEQATKEYEETRESVALLINARNSAEIVFTRNTTESINLVAHSLGTQIVKQGDEIVTTIMEHHSNFVPWQELAHKVGATFKVIDIDDDGQLDLFSQRHSGKPSLRRGASRIPKRSFDFAQDDEHRINNIITKKTKILALTYVSNVLATVNPIREIVKEAKRINPSIMVIVDAAQAVPHIKVNVRELGCDFLVFSGHKMLGPTGVGVLWGKYSLLDSMTPFQYGGEMIERVEMASSTFKKPPHKFEAGTPHIGGVIGFKSAIQYLEKIGLNKIQAHEHELRHYALQMLREEFGHSIHMFGGLETTDRCGVIAFTLDSCHPHDIAQILDESHIAVRAGHHCAMPLHTRLGITASARASFYVYNDKKDVEKLVEGLKKAKKLLQTTNNIAM